MFEKKGLMLVSRKAQSQAFTQDSLMEKLLEYDLEDVNVVDEDLLEVVCDPSKMLAVKRQAEAGGLKISESEITSVPKTMAACLEDTETLQLVEDLVSHLDNLEDVVRVHTNLP